MKAIENFQYYSQELRSFHFPDGRPYYRSLFLANEKLQGILEMYELIRFAKFLFGIDFDEGYDQLIEESQNGLKKRHSLKTMLDTDMDKRESGFFNIKRYANQLNDFLSNNFDEKDKVVFCYLLSIEVLREAVKNYKPDFELNYIKDRVESSMPIFELVALEKASQYYCNETSHIFQYFGHEIKGKDAISPDHKSIAQIDFAFALYMIVVTNGVILRKSNGNTQNLIKLCQYISTESPSMEELKLEQFLKGFDQISVERIPKVLNMISTSFSDSSKVCQTIKAASIDRYIRDGFDLFYGEKSKDALQNREDKCSQHYPELSECLKVFLLNLEQFKP